TRYVHGGRTWICGMTGIEPMPQYTVLPGDTFSVTQPLQIIEQDRGQTLTRYLYVFTSSHNYFGFSQHTHLDLLNPLDLEMLSPSGTSLIFRIRTGSGEAFSGSARLNIGSINRYFAIVTVPFAI